MKHVRNIFIWLATLILCVPITAYAQAFDEPDDAQVYRLIDTDNRYLTSHARRVFVGDEYISADNTLYRAIKIDDQARMATMQNMGSEPEADRAAFASIFTAYADEKKLICMYSTHSDESYEPTDGTSSKIHNAGIYDVGEALKKNLEKLGVSVEYSQDTFHPHDAGAYRRSRSAVEEYIKQAPAAVLDLHRDGIPDPDEYTEEIDGADITKVRLLVGRSNQNAQANRAFAKEIKARADKEYPGLIKDIFIGRGNYNQELYPKALLMEFGTHTTNKERAIESTGYMAEVLNDVLFGESAQATTTEQNQAGATGIGWAIGAAVLLAVVYALVSTGTFKQMTQKLVRNTSEITGGLIGKKPEDRE